MQQVSHNLIVIHVFLACIASFNKMLLLFLFCNFDIINRVEAGQCSASFYSEIKNVEMTTDGAGKQEKAQIPKFFIS